MKTLLILRHAKSSWKFPDRSDHDRPLNRRGKRDAPKMGRLLKEKGPSSRSCYQLDCYSCEGYSFISSKTQWIQRQEY